MAMVRPEATESPGHIAIPGLSPDAQPRQNVLDLDDFSAPEIISVLDGTTAMGEVLRRDIKKVPTLRGRVVVTLFYEADRKSVV